MSLDEAIQAANFGSADAMVMLGDFYSKRDNPNYDLDEAIKWYELAAEQGRAGAMFCAMLYRKEDAVLSQMIGNLQSAFTSFSMSYKWAGSLIQSDAINAMDDDKYNLCIDCYYGGLYGAAQSAYYDAKKYANALEFAKMAEGAGNSPVRAKAQILEGLCLIKIGREYQGEQGVDTLAEALQKLTEAFSDKTYASTAKPKLEEIAFAQGLLHLANFYRGGIPGKKSPDCAAAVDLIHTNIGFIEAEELKDMVLEQLGEF